MSWITNSARAAAMALSCASVAANAGSLVVRSVGPSAGSYPAGMKLADHQKIVLRASDRIVVLDGGGTRTLTGPGVFDPTVASSAASDSRTTLLALVTQRTERRARIGAVRSVTGPTSPRSPNVWYIDSERSSTACVTDPATVTLWRADMAAARRLKVTRVSDHQTGNVDWLKGESARGWPGTMPVTSGAEYRLDWGPGQPPVTVRFAVLGPNPGGLEDVAAALIRNGCNAQLDLLVETVAVPAAAAPPAG